MKVNELRNMVKGRSKEELQFLLAEMYKLIPKKVREEKNIDSLIENPEQFKNKRKSTKQAMTISVDFSKVELETNHFIENAYEQNYVAPNRIIPKRERANWRFTAKRLVNQLTELASQPESAKASIELLEKLYALFCYASGHYVFASQEPFDTIKLPQSDFFERIVSLKKRNDEPKKWIRESLLLMLENDPGYVMVNYGLMESLFENLTNAPLKEEAIAICEELLQEKSGVKKKKKGRSSSYDYETENYINHLVCMIFIFQSSLNEYEKAIQIFNKYYTEPTKEIKLYVLLEWIMLYQRVEDWLREYELAVRNGVEPRDRLQKAYKKIMETKEFPEYI